ncbi:MAG TPA: hypothetical protein VD905_00185 [Flavobacteriales bacterium]|nr:hypothetical protein [Flavobacteriales bacterium]
MSIREIRFYNTFFHIIKYNEKIKAKVNYSDILVLKDFHSPKRSVDVVLKYSVNGKEKKVFIEARSTRSDSTHGMSSIKNFIGLNDLLRQHSVKTVYSTVFRNMLEKHKHKTRD